MEQYAHPWPQLAISIGSPAALDSSTSAPSAGMELRRWEYTLQNTYQQKHGNPGVFPRNDLCIFPTYDCFLESNWEIQHV